jgi:hypothetical protein
MPGTGAGTEVSVSGAIGSSGSVATAAVGAGVAEDEGASGGASAWTGSVLLGASNGGCAAGGGTGCGGDPQAKAQNSAIPLERNEPMNLGGDCTRFRRGVGALNRAPASSNRFWCRTLESNPVPRIHISRKPHRNRMVEGAADAPDSAPKCVIRGGVDDSLDNSGRGRGATDGCRWRR